MKYVIQESTLTGIGDAIRAKGGTSELIPVTGLADAITNLPTGGGGEDIEPVVLTGTCQYACSGPVSAQFVKYFPNKISTKDISTASNMFNGSTLENIPFAINASPSSSSFAMNNMFRDAAKLKTVPEMNNIKPTQMDGMFYSCQNIHFPENIGENWDWSYMTSQTGAYAGNQSQLFAFCYSLRKLPFGLLKYGNPNATYSYSIYYYLIYCGYALDEIINLPLTHYNASWTSNAFVSFVNECYRLKEMTFALQEDGSPYVMKWKSQTIDLSQYIGWGKSSALSYLTSYRSGITADKEVKDDATYQALKNDADWFTRDINYSRYNHTSAVNTINSLPDCSATGTNTIKFKGAAGALTDGGAINTLTEAEIAVAAAKGWTVTFV